jgi:hypothetical protein
VQIRKFPPLIPATPGFPVVPPPVRGKSIAELAAEFEAYLEVLRQQLQRQHVPGILIGREDPRLNGFLSRLSPSAVQRMLFRCGDSLDLNRCMWSVIIQHFSSETGIMLALLKQNMKRQWWWRNGYSLEGLSAWVPAGPVVHRTVVTAWLEFVRIHHPPPLPGGCPP